MCEKFAVHIFSKKDKSNIIIVNKSFNTTTYNNYNDLKVKNEAHTKQEVVHK